MTSHKICEYCYGRLANLLPVKPGKIPARVKCPQVNIIDKCINLMIHYRYGMNIAWKSYDENQMFKKAKVHAIRDFFSFQGDCDYASPPFRNLEIEEMIRNYELEVIYTLFIDHIKYK